MSHVAVIGGGLTGLSVAFRLRQLDPHVRVTVLESREKSGGNIGTEDHRGFRVERGPNGFLDRTPSVPKLCRDLGLAHRLICASEAARKNRFLFLDGTLKKMPRGPLGLLTSSLLTWKGKWQLLTEPWQRSVQVAEDESVSQFVTRRAGHEAAEIFADALVTGIHGGDPALLSVAAAFPRLPVMEREAGSVIRGFIRAAKLRNAQARARGEPRPGPMRMWSFREGLQTLTDALAATLGNCIRTNVRVTGISESASNSPWKIYGEDRQAWSADAVVVACPSYEQAALLAELNESLAREVAGIPYNRIAVVALGYRQSDCPFQPDGFGYIAPQHTRRDILGVQWCSSIFPDRAPHGHVLWRVLCGGIHRAEMVDWEDQTLVRAVHAEMKLAMAVVGEPVFVRVIRWPAAIPQYVIGHLDRLARIDALTARHPGLFLTGNAYRGVAMSDCVEQGEIVARNVIAYLSTLN